MRPSRRQVLAATVAIPSMWVASGCTLSGPGGDRSGGRSGTPRPTGTDPDAAVLEAATAQVTELVALLERAVDQRPDVSDALQPLLAGHRRHAEVLGAAGSAVAPTRSPGASGTPTPGTSVAPLPRGRRQVLSELAGAEQRAAAAHLRHVRRAASGPFARLLASISAAESQHATVLQEAAR